MVRGEPGVGKTALLEYAIESASQLRVVRALGKVFGKLDISSRNELHGALPGEPNAALPV